jgi:hypothetical protein
LGYTLTPSALTIAASRSLANSGAIVEDLTLLQRIYPGTGMQGSWRQIDLDYRVVSGTPDTEEQSELDGRLADRRWQSSFEEDEYEFTPNVILYYRDKRTADLAMARWDGQGPPGTASPESLAYDMDARAVDKYTMEYKGRATGETVRVTTLSNGDADYSSSDTSHHPMHYSENSTTCPLSSWPDWYENFRNANSRSGVPAPKAAASDPASSLSPITGASSSKTKQPWMYP